MNVLTVCAVAIMVLCVIVVIKQLRPEMVPIAVAAAGIILFAYLVISLVPVINFVKDAAKSSGLSGYFEVLIKSLAIALCCQACAEVCRDCGENSLASKVELAGKIGIIVLSLPILQQLLGLAKNMF